MARLRSASRILDAAERWKQECLLGGGSLCSNERLWNGANFHSLKAYFVDRPDESGDSFDEKLKRQLESAPPESQRLWAEMTWLYYLIVVNVKRVTKLDRIRTVWEWSGEPFPEDHWAFGDVLDHGIVHPGQGYLQNRWRESTYIIEAMLDWFGRSAEQQQSLVEDPWRFADWLDELAGSRQLQFRHALLFLLFPDAFQNSMSTHQKRAMVVAFDGVAAADINALTRTDLDKALLDVASRLQDQCPGEEIDFYGQALARRWRHDLPPRRVQAHHEDDGETWYEGRFGSAHTWLIAPGEGARLWRDFQHGGIVAIGYDHLGDLSEYADRQAVHAALIRRGGGENPSNHSLAAWQFAHEIAVGDILVAKQGRHTILGWGRVAGDYAHDPERPEYCNTRRVEWHPCGTPIRLDAPMNVKTLTCATPYWDWLRDVFALIDGDAPPAGRVTYTLADALEELFLEETQFRRMLDSIALRKNLILQGAPGVGKTFVARRLAWCLIGRKDTEAIEMVQFHQSYAYEDFVQGWRPTEAGGFTLRKGVFYEFCKRADKRPDVPYVFIIDEINRGNLSRIFGELLMLIEADKRGPEHSIMLTYGAPGERFHVPENVHVLGMMNTADRSLAIVDYALRRRFAFETLDPVYGTSRFREHLLEADVERSLVDRIDRNLSSLNEVIRADPDLGPGFQIGHSYFVPEESADEQWYLGIVDTQIAPLLREYWFDHPERVDSLVTDLRG